MGVDPSFERCEVWAMFSKTAKPIMRSAAWRISLWATLAFACGTMVVFIFLHQFVAGDIQRRTDAWLAGEAGVLSDVAARTPKGVLYQTSCRRGCRTREQGGAAQAGSQRRVERFSVLPSNRRRWLGGFVGGSGGCKRPSRCGQEQSGLSRIRRRVYTWPVLMRPFAWSASG